MSISSLKTGVVSPSSLLAGNTGYQPLTVTGGTLYSDATYYYNAFTGSGTLSITGGSGTLTADIL